MRVAIPTKNNRIDPQYSRAAEFTIYEIEIELVKKKEVVPLGKTAIADFLTEQDINAVICGNIRSSARRNGRRWCMWARAGWPLRSRSGRCPMPPWVNCSA